MPSHLVLRTQRLVDIYVGLSLLGATISFITGLSRVRDFFMWGTALGASAWLLVLLGILRWLTNRQGRSGRLALIGLTVLSAGATAAAAGEPATWRALDDHRALQLVFDLALFVVPAMAAVTGWRAIRATRQPARGIGRVLRFLGAAVFVLVYTVNLAIACAFGRTEEWLQRRWTVADRPLDVKATPEQLARGEHLARGIAGCTNCHGDDLAGKTSDDIPLVVTVRAPNITRGKGGVVAKFTAADWARMLRDGVKPDGRSARIMPIEGTSKLGDADLAALIAWLERVPPVDHEMAEPSIGPVGRVVWALGIAPLGSAWSVEHVAAPVHDVAPGRTSAYGRYLIGVGACTSCHGPQLRGGPIPGAPSSIPPATNLTPDGPLAAWSEAQFVTTLRTGVDPTGHTLDAMMPWRSLAPMSDDELGAIWLALKEPL